MNQYRADGAETRPRLVVVGNGMAGARFLEELARHAPDSYQVTVLGAESHGAYNRILLSPLLAAETSFDEIALQTADWYHAHGFERRLGESVVGIDREHQLVHTERGTSIAYDRLVLATGSKPFRPPIPGIDLQGVLAFRTIEDVRAILSRAIQGRSAVVIGGGLLGLEAAYGLQKHGMRVNIVHLGPYLLERQLDAEAAECLRRSLIERGMGIELDIATKALIGDTQVHFVRLVNGRVLPADLVVVAAGVQPETDLARSAGLTVARGVLVDDRLQTSDPHVHAIGECVEHRGAVYGLVAPLWEQARCLAALLGGDSTARYHGSVTATQLKVTGIDLYSAGDISPSYATESLIYRDRAVGCYRHLLLRDDRLVGAVLYGDVNDGSWYFELIQNATPISAVRDLLVFGKVFCKPLEAVQPADGQVEGSTATAGSTCMTGNTRLVVVGNGMVGQQLLQALTDNERQECFEITVFSAEPRPAYDRVHLSEFFTGRGAEDLSLVAADFFETRDITIHLGERVVAIDRERRLVRSEQGREVAYDHLVLATGSYPFVPPLPGRDLPHCLVYRTVEDLESIRASAVGARAGVVIGGGLLGLEAANALRQLGLETHVVEMAPRLMPVQLDDEGGAMLRGRIEGLGLQVHTEVRTQCIEPGGSARLRLCFADGNALDTDLIVFSAGIRPHDALAVTADLKLGERGGIAVDNRCRTSDPAISAIGECAAWNGQIFGLVAPGYAMARVVADHLCDRENAFTGADMSTKLKLLGVDVASIGDAHGHSPGAKAFRYVDEPNQIYAKLVVNDSGKELLGAVLVGDASAYDTLLQYALNGLTLPETPQRLIIPGGDGDAPAFGPDALPDAAQICSCHNVTKGAIVAVIDAGGESLVVVKEQTRASSGCGGCAALLKRVVDHELSQRGVEINRDICEHFAYTRQDLYHLVQVEQIRTFSALLAGHGRGRGCDICKPAVASILASVWNDYVLADEHVGLQDSNDTFLANLQKDGSYSVVPRIPGGEITPQRLIALGEVGQRYGLYTKITGGQRVDLFGARVEQLPKIWSDLIEAGFETGHAYGKAVRTVKSCVGSTWCRYGVQDSVGMAVDMENRYKGLRAPHKLKFAVSGCTRECAEAQSKDIGVIATEGGWNLYVCGNGGMRPRHADLFATDLDDETLIRYVDRILMFYVRTADRLQRTATWLENLEGGIEYLRDVVINDRLGIAESLQAQMAHVIDTYECEWKKTLADPGRLVRFRQFVNSDAADGNIAFVEERGQPRPARPDEKALSVTAAMD